MTSVAHPAIRSETWKGWRLSWLWLALLAMLVAGSFAVLWRRPPNTWMVDLQQPEIVVPFEVEGVNALERNDGQRYRWTTDYPFVQLQHAYYLAQTFEAGLTIRSDRPDGPRPVTFMLNEQPIAVVQATADLRTYTLLLPHRPDAEGSLRFAAATENLVTPGDPRRLGFITTWWQLTAFDPQAGIGSLGPGEVVLVVLGALALALFMLWRRGWQTAVTTGTLMLVALVTLRQLYQPSPVPYNRLALIALLAMAGLPWLARCLPTLLALSAVVMIVVFSGALWPSWITDDALISFRYAQNLYEGNGLVYNVGERVEGYTNFLWTMLASTVFVIGGDPVPVSYYAGIIIGLLVVAATAWQARQWYGEDAMVAVAALLGTNHSLLVYTARGSGLETGAFALSLIVASALFLRERFSSAGVAFALAAMMRPEGVLILSLAGMLRLAQQRRVESGNLRMVGAFLVLGLPYFLWRFGYYGELLPNTFYAKTGGGLAQALRGLRYAGSFVLFAGGALFVLLLGLAGWRLRSAGSIERKGLIITWLVVVIYSLYVIAVGGDHFPGYRFFTPILPFFALLLVAGLYQIGDMLPTAWKTARMPLILALVVGLSTFNLSRSSNFDQIIRGDDESVWIWREIGWWLADHGQPQESMAAMGAGAIPYYSRHPTIDLLGLNDKHIARVTVENMGQSVAGHEKRDPEYVLHVRKPTYIPDLWVEYFGGARALKATGLYVEQEMVTRFGRRLKVWQRIP
jgi:arabinofuranosyltransferase